MDLRMESAWIISNMTYKPIHCQGYIFQDCVELIIIYMEFFIGNNNNLFEIVI